MHKYILFLVLFFRTGISLGQSDMVGSGHALSFDGVDDYVDLGNIYDDLTLPISISVWIKVTSAPSYLYPIFNTQDNLPIYNGVTFAVSINSIGIQYGDGRGEGSSSFRRGKGANIPNLAGRWVHIAANMRSPNDMDIFVNGVNVGGFYDGTTPLPMASDSPGDVAKIGYWHSNGSTYLFKGEMDELRFWKRALSEGEIRNQMCRKLSGNESGLIGYWTFDETTGTTIVDKSMNHFNGTIKGNVNRVYSGAPIGDESTYMYPSNWLSSPIAFVDGATTIEAFGFTNNVPGAQIYKVASIPSQTNGLLSDEIKSPYFGVFAAIVSAPSNFSVQQNTSSISVCKIKSREDNSISNWIEMATDGVQNRLEFIGIGSGSDFNFSLGEDRITCDPGDIEIATGLDPTGKSFQWSTGETSPTIDVNTSGNYSVTVMEGCNSKSDEIVILFSSPPPLNNFLGNDIELCKVESFVLKPFTESTDYYFTWQDGSHDDSFQIPSLGKYWLKVENYCGVGIDTVELRQLTLSADKIPNVITPNNGDEWNQYFVINQDLLGSYLAVFNRWGKLVYENEDYQNEWDGGNLDNGIYFYLVRNHCQNEAKGALSIIR